LEFINTEEQKRLKEEEKKYDQVELFSLFCRCSLSQFFFRVNPLFSTGCIAPSPKSSPAPCVGGRAADSGADQSWHQQTVLFSLLLGLAYQHFPVQVITVSGVGFPLDGRRPAQAKLAHG
jgi:hypothetical protein